MNYNDELRRRGLQQRLLITTHAKIYGESISYVEISRALTGQRNSAKSKRIRETCRSVIAGYDEWLNDFIAHNG